MPNSSFKIARQPPCAECAKQHADKSRPHTSAESHTQGAGHHHRPENSFSVRRSRSCSEYEADAQRGTFEAQRAPRSFSVLCEDILVRIGRAVDFGGALDKVWL